MVGVERSAWVDMEKYMDLSWLQVVAWTLLGESHRAFLSMLLLSKYEALGRLDLTNVWNDSKIDI